MYNHKWWRIVEGDRAKNKNSSDELAVRLMAIVQLDDVKKILRLDSPQSLTHAQCVHEWAIHFFTFSFERVREREDGEWINTSGWTEAREGGKDLPAKYCGTYLEVCRCRATLTTPLIGWYPLGPPGSAPRIPGEQRARILFEVALPSPISRVEERIQLALKTNTSNWPRIRDIHFVISTIVCDSCNIAFSLHSKLKGHRNY